MSVLLELFVNRYFPGFQIKEVNAEACTFKIALKEDSDTVVRTGSISAGAFQAFGEGVTVEIKASWDGRNTTLVIIFKNVDPSWFASPPNWLKIWERERFPGRPAK